ncbi:MAG: S-layer homology domain-containing protein [Clostridia bacterium]|nr:S-layer homology domain-containing protein [Clostridia bacterium]
MRRMRFFPLLALLLALALVMPTTALAADPLPGTTPENAEIGQISTDIPSNYPSNDRNDTLFEGWTMDQRFTLADPAPWNLAELKQVVDVKDPRSVAAYFVWAVNRMVDNREDGMEMMKYLFADLEPFGRGFTEGGLSGQAGWDSYFDERLTDPDYRWLPRAYFLGGTADNGFVPFRPLMISLVYNQANTESANAQSLAQLGRLNIVYTVESEAGGNRVSITLSRFEGSDRWYVTSGATSAALFYDQRSALTPAEVSLAGVTAGDPSTTDDHTARYGTDFGDDPAPAAHEHEWTPMRNDASHWSECLVCGEFKDAADHVFEGGVCTGCGLEQPAAPAHVHEWIPMRNDASHWTECLTCGEFKDAGDHVYEGGACLGCGMAEPGLPGNFPFTDVSDRDYFFDAVVWAYNNNVTKGSGGSTFGPADNCTRAQVVTFLHRAAGSPAPASTVHPFVDVPADAWYRDAVLWAVEQGITGGTAADTFSPDQACSSAHIITFLFRATGGENGWYEEARSWAAQQGLLEETGLTVSPDELCPRGAVVAFLYRVYG